MARDVLPPPVIAALEGGNKIEAIKLLRDMTGLGLKEAKAWIDSYERRAPAPERHYDEAIGLDPSAALNKSTSRAPKDAFKVPPAAVDALKRGDLAGALKIFGEFKDESVAEVRRQIEEARKVVHQVQGSSSDASNRSAPETPRRPGLAPGQVDDGADSGKWLVLIAVAVLGVLAAFYFA